MRGDDETRFVDEIKGEEVARELSERTVGHRVKRGQACMG